MNPPGLPTPARPRLRRLGIGTRREAVLYLHRDCAVCRSEAFGLPGNRTTMIEGPIAAAGGLRMPRTSSRAIASPAGQAAEDS